MRMARGASPAALLFLAVNPSPANLLVSVIVLNYNGARWLERCLDSLRAQTIFDRIEVIVADNVSTDGSERLGKRIVEGWPRGRFHPAWPEPGLLRRQQPCRRGRSRPVPALPEQRHVAGTALPGETAGGGGTDRRRRRGPLMLNYDDDSFQSLGAFGFDLFGLASTRALSTQTREVLMPEGCAYLIRRELFQQLGRFDPEFFMFADELDLSWRVWISGQQAIAVPVSEAASSRRGAGQSRRRRRGGRVSHQRHEALLRNRNGLLVLLKNCASPPAAAGPAAALPAGRRSAGRPPAGARAGLCEACLPRRPGGLLAAARTHPGRAPADPAVPPPRRSVHAALPALALEPLGRTPTAAPIRCAEE